MKVTIIKKNKLIDFVLPMQVHGNYWIKDEDRNLKERNLINVVDNNNKYKLTLDDFYYKFDRYEVYTNEKENKKDTHRER